jgi:hypothetical protein
MQQSRSKIDNHRESVFDEKDGEGSDSSSADVYLEEIGVRKVLPQGDHLRVRGEIIANKIATLVQQGVLNQTNLPLLCSHRSYQSEKTTTTAV